MLRLCIENVKMRMQVREKGTIRGFCNSYKNLKTDSSGLKS